jgi:hypothetical protein
VTNREWLRLFCTRLALAGYPRQSVSDLVEKSEVDEIRLRLDPDPVAAAEAQLELWE